MDENGVLLGRINTDTMVADLKGLAVAITYRVEE